MLHLICFSFVQHKAMRPRPTTILFLSTGNGLRSLMAEAILNHQDSCGDEKFVALSAGIIPKARPNQVMLDLLSENGISCKDLTPKSFYPLLESQFAIFIDVIVTLSEEAKELCPEWTGGPSQIHWHLPDPMESLTKDELITKTQKCFYTLQDRISILTHGSRPLSSLNLAIQMRSLAHVM